MAFPSHDSVWKNISTRRLILLLKHRLEMGFPIKKLILPDRPSSFRPYHDIDVLREHVEVELFDWLSYYDSRDIDLGGKTF